MWPKSRRRKRSVTRIASLRGCPKPSSQALSLKPVVSTTSVSHLPASHGRPHPARDDVSRVLRQAAPVDVDLARRITVPRENHNLARGLNHLEVQNEHHGREAAGLAVRALEIATALLPLFEESGGLRSKQRLAGGHIPEHVDHVLRDIVDIWLDGGQPGPQHPHKLTQGRALGMPQARQVGRSVQPRRRRGQIRQPVSRARSLANRRSRWFRILK